MIVIGSIATVRFALGVRRLAREARDLREHANALTVNLDAAFFLEDLLAPRPSNRSVE